MPARSKRPPAKNRGQSGDAKQKVQKAKKEQKAQKRSRKPTAAATATAAATVTATATTLKKQKKKQKQNQAEQVQTEARCPDYPTPPHRGPVTPSRSATPTPVRTPRTTPRAGRTPTPTRLVGTPRCLLDHLEESVSCVEQQLEQQRAQLARLEEERQQRRDEAAKRKEEARQRKQESKERKEEALKSREAQRQRILDELGDEQAELQEELDRLEALEEDTLERLEGAREVVSQARDAAEEAEEELQEAEKEEAGMMQRLESLKAEVLQAAERRKAEEARIATEVAEIERLTRECIQKHTTDAEQLYADTTPWVLEQEGAIRSRWITTHSDELSLMQERAEIDKQIVVLRVQVYSLTASYAQRHSVLKAGKTKSISMLNFFAGDGGDSSDDEAALASAISVPAVTPARTVQAHVDTKATPLSTVRRSSLLGRRSAEYSPGSVLSGVFSSPNRTPHSQRKNMESLDQASLTSSNSANELEELMQTLSRATRGRGSRHLLAKRKRERRSSLQELDLMSPPRINMRRLEAKATTPVQQHKRARTSLAEEDKLSLEPGPDLDVPMITVKPVARVSGVLKNTAARNSRPKQTVRFDATADATKTRFSKESDFQLEFEPV